MRVLLVEPWFGGSHRAWAEGYARHSSHDVQLLTLGPEGWKWRIRGAALTLAREVAEPPDVVIASSLLDVAQFLGHARAQIGDAPVLLYMHENQLTYPLPEGTRRDLGPALTNWTSMVAADLVVFNSEFHRRVWFGAVREMLGTMPDPNHLDLVPEVEAASQILPIGVELGWVETGPKLEPGAPLIVWNHRWEHDKRPDLFAAAVRELLGGGALFRVAICGEAPTGMPDDFVELPGLLGDRLLQFGHAERPRYEQILRSADVVVSTADHEFFGVAVIEGMAAGAFPVVPNRLSYPELMPPSVLADGMFSTPEELVERLAAALAERADREMLAAAARPYAWESVAPAYDRTLEHLAG